MEEVSEAMGGVINARAIGERLKGSLSSFVVPCLDEEEVLPIFYRELSSVMAEIGNPEYEIVFVEDGSRDGTLDVLKRLAEGDRRVRYVSFSRNFGKEAAIYAGLKYARGDYVAIMDADLQDPPSLLPEMYQAVLDGGFDCVATQRSTRTGEGAVRSFFSNAFYYWINALSAVKLVPGARDFRLMKRSVVDAILSLPETGRFTKGIYEWVGFRTKRLAFKNMRRRAGRTKWSLAHLFFYAIDGITAFSTVPLAIASVVGFLFFMFSSAAIVFLVVRKILYWDSSVYGWSSMMCVIFFLSGLQLMCLGVIGQYLAKTYLETKRRPPYIVRETNAGR